MTTNGSSKTPDENPMKELAAEGAARMEQLLQEYKKLEAQQRERTVEMIDESARIMKASMEYGMKLTDEMRKVALQANKQAVEMMTAKWF